MGAGNSDGLIARILYYASVLFEGVGATVAITAGALSIAVVLGLALAMLKVSNLPAARFCVNAYVEVFRNIPPLTQLFIIYFGLTYVGVRLEPLAAAIIGLGLNGSAYCTEIFRSGFSALHHGQREAAAAAGMTPAKTMRFVILPQALRITLPPLANYAIGLIKDTAVASSVAAPEILFRARSLTSETYETPLIYLLVAILYFCLTFPLARWADRLERKRKGWT